MVYPQKLIPPLIPEEDNKSAAFVAVCLNQQLQRGGMGLHLAHWCFWHGSCHWFWAQGGARKACIYNQFWHLEAFVRPVGFGKVYHAVEQFLKFPSHTHTHSHREDAVRNSKVNSPQHFIA